MEVLVRLLIVLLRILFRLAIGLIKLGLTLAFGLEFDDKKPVPVQFGDAATDDYLDDGDYLDEHDELDVDEIRRRLQEVDTRARSLRNSIEWDRANHTLKGVLDDFVIPRSSAWASRIEGEAELFDLGVTSALDELEVILGEISILAHQRTTTELRHDLGDADALAAACYEPLTEFARTNQVALTSTTPMVQLTKFDMATWTAFVPTGVAPIFLPPDFFQRLAWWPALAHEIAHDFLAATHHVDSQLRWQLDLCSESEGSQFISLTEEGLAYSELSRVFGSWLEEMFCDAVATMMMGPAYGWTMVELFSGSLHEISAVPVQDGQFSTHPPRHLRLLNCVQLLELMGHPEHGRDIRAEWEQRNADVEDYRYMTVYGESLQIPAEPVQELSQELVKKLYHTQLEAFADFPLQSIPGLDFGPAAAAETERAKLAFLADRVPTSKNAHRVIAGAILAWRDSPGKEKQILRHCRVALVGEAEWAERGPAPAHRPRRGYGGKRASAREAFLLSTLLAPPKALARSRPKRGFGERYRGPS
ncbi:MAG: hypothetical protein GY811_09960 [Myxococcales bacterium]|nr:hypothetical protein [Myxococcales bacterium]